MTREDIITIATIEDALAAFEPERLPDPDKVWQRASVAMIFAGPAEDPSLCFIKRADREGDRWSGQMAFPGGRASDGDANPIETAIRETQEEVGIALNAEQVIGQLSEAPLHRHGSSFYGVLSPICFYIGQERPAFVLEESEVALAFWIPVNQLFDHERRATLDWELEDGARTLTFPGISHEGEIIWGLTYRVLEVFTELLGLEGVMVPLPKLDV
ncbi:MAG: CoA pyrophosphatase [Myxococcota bacterium]|jgi:8-oxo-dGTP pyrophosphatase MutT (NUDIX family)|nr:CoA pyrophosphatase [Myxococcota bacterium]